MSPSQAQAYSALRLQPLGEGIEEDSGEQGTVESEAGSRRAGLTKAHPEKQESELGRGWADDPCNAPGGPASPIPGPGVSKQSGLRLSSASSVYGLTAARPVAGRGIRNVPCAVEGPGKAGEELRPA